MEGGRGQTNTMMGMMMINMMMMMMMCRPIILYFTEDRHGYRSIVVRTMSCRYHFL